MSKNFLTPAETANSFVDIGVYKQRCLKIRFGFWFSSRCYML